MEKLSPNLSPDEIDAVSKQFFSLFSNLLQKAPLYYQTPFEPFMVYLKVAFLTSIFISFPFVFYFLWEFFEPALKERERKVVFPSIFFATILFIGGALIGYFWIFPYIIQFALSYSSTELIPILTINSYFKIFSRMLLGFGFIFELPLILIILAIFNIVTSKGLIKFFRYAVIIVFILSAIITPPDIISQIFLSLPLIGLYGISILAVIFIEKIGKKEK